MIRRLILALLLLVGSAFATSSAALAAKYALVVAVSDYNKRAMQPLRGPANDVRLIWDMLLDRGFDPDSISVLADRMASGESRPKKLIRPTRSNIVAAFEGLTKELAAKKDEEHFVFVYFSGHGSRQPQFEYSDDVEPDNFDEVFLPIDVGMIDPFTRKIKNGLVDDEIKTLLGSLQSAKNAFVWAVFDACHSGDMTRGVAPKVQAKFTPTAAFVPDAELAEWNRAVRSLAQQKPNAASKQEIKTADRWLGGVEEAPTGLAVFSAARADKLALEVPIREANNDVYSIFTYHLVKAMRQAPHASFRDLAASIERLNASFETSLPSPMYEGALDREFTLDASKARGWRWPVRVDDNHEFVEFPIGTLAGVEKGSILELESGADEGQSTGYVEVVDASLASAKARPIAFREQPPPDLPNLQGPLFATVLSRQIPLVLLVAIRDDASQLDLEIKRAIQRESGGRRLPIEWVSSDALAEAYLFARDGQIHILPGTANPENLASESHFAVPLSDSLERTAALVRENLWKLIRQRNLLRIAAGVSQTKLADQIKVRMHRIRPPAPPAASSTTDRYRCPPPNMIEISSGGEQIESTDPSELRHCDILRLEVSNVGDTPVQVAGLLLGSDASVRFFNIGNRPIIEPRQILPATSFIQVVTWCAEADCKKFGMPIGEQSTGRERLLLVAFELAHNEAPRSLHYLAQPSLSRARKASQSARRSGVSQLELMLRQAALLPETRSVLATNNQSFAVKLLQWDVVRPTPIE
jgi:Caspase domain